MPDSVIRTPFWGQPKTLRVFFRDSEPVDLPEGSMAGKWLGWINMLMDFIAERIPLGMCVELDNDSTPKAMEVMQKKFPSFVIKEQKPYEYVISEEEDSEDDSEEEESQAGES